MEPNRAPRRAIIAAASLALVLGACSSDGASSPSTPAVSPTDVRSSEPVTAPAGTVTDPNPAPVTEAPDATPDTPDTTPVTTPPSTDVSATVEEIATTPDQLVAALDVDPAQLGDGFAVAPPDAPDVAAALEETRVGAAAATAACDALPVLTATPDFSRVYATPSSDVVTIHVFIVDPPAAAGAVFDDVAGNVDQLAECLLAIGSASLDTFFGTANPTGITGGTQRLVGSVPPPTALTADGAVAFDSKTDLEGSSPFTIDGKFVVFRTGDLIVTVEGGSLTDASGPADHAAAVVASLLAPLVT